MSKYNIDILSTDKYSDWDTLVITNNASPFLTSAWLRAYCGATNEKFEIIGCYDKNNVLIAGYAYVMREKIGKFKLLVNLLGIDNYIVFTPRDTRFVGKKESYYFEIVSSFTTFLESRFNHVEFTLGVNEMDIRPYKWNNYNQQVRYTYFGIIYLPEKMLANFNPDIRNKIKKAEKLDYEYRSETNESEIITSYYLIEKSLKKNKQPHIMTLNQFVKFCLELSDAEMLKVHNIYLEGAPVATRVIVTNKTLAIDFQAGGNELLFNSGLNQMLTFKIFQDLFKQGIQEFDFRGANTPSVAKYKSGFNFEAKPYFKLKKDSGFIFKTLMSLKDRI